MYIIYLILSIFGITSPYATNENRHGESHFQSSSQVASDMLENFHTKAESICLTAGNQSCNGGIVQQDHINDNSSYGKGVISVSDGKTQVATFMPYSTSYRFNPVDISSDVYNKINNITGKGINTGYYDQNINQIVMKDGSMQPLPQGMKGFQLYNRMPVLITSLKGSEASIARGGEVGSSDTSVMDNLRNGGVNTTTKNNMVNYPHSVTCANGDAGTAIKNNISCGNSKDNVPSTNNNQVGGTTNAPGIGGNNAGEIPPYTDNSNNFDDENDGIGGNNTTNLNYSNDGTMKMGTVTNNGNNSDENGDEDSDETAINVDSGNNVPVASGYINNCKDIVFPQADPSKIGKTSFGYSYNYDYYVDIGQCNSFVRPSIDNLDSNYAVFPYNPNDSIVSKQGWAYKVHDYQYFDWFGSDDENAGIRNPQSSKWKTNSTDCSVTLLADIYNSSYADLEAMSIQSMVSGTSDTLNNMNCNNQGGGVNQGGENGVNLSYVNDDIQNVFSKVNGNQGPYFNQPFQYWGMTWMCYPDTKDFQNNIIHYHVTCTPKMNFVPQINNYTDYNIWKNFIEPNNYPLGGLFSIGHKGANNIAGQWPNDISDSEGDDSSYHQYGINTNNDDYYGQAIASYYPFAITSNIQDSSSDGVSNVFHKYSVNKGNNSCSANNYANAPDIVPSGDCSGNMGGILTARNRKFFDYTQSLLQNEANVMNGSNVKSEASSWDGTIIAGTAGFPKRDSDGVWRWHLSDLQAPSFNTPSGTKIDSSTNINDVKKDDYFSYTGTVSPDEIYGNSVNNVGDVNVPSDIGFNNNTPISPAGGHPKDTTTNGYSYSCQLGNYNGYDYTTGQLKYDVNCTLNKIPEKNNGNNGNTGNSKGHYNVVCDFLGAYDLSNNNGSPACISFSNPKGEADGNTYYYYLPNGSLPSNSPTNPLTHMARSTLSSDQFTFGYVPGNGLSIGGNPAKNRDWGDQIDNRKYDNSDFTFNFSPSGLMFSNSDKTNSQFPRKDVSKPTRRPYMVLCPFGTTLPNGIAVSVNFPSPVELTDNEYINVNGLCTVTKLFN